eukprot:scaffold40618_cov21-Tisochrysis_lutea.AAC.1
MGFVLLSHQPGIEPSAAARNHCKRDEVDWWSGWAKVGKDLEKKKKSTFLGVRRDSTFLELPMDWTSTDSNCLASSTGWLFAIVDRNFNRDDSLTEGLKISQCVYENVGGSGNGDICACEANLGVHGLDTHKVLDTHKATKLTLKFHANSVQYAYTLASTRSAPEKTSTYFEDQAQVHC